MKVFLDFFNRIPHSHSLLNSQSIIVYYHHQIGSIWINSPIAPKKSVQRVVHRSVINDKVCKAKSFSPKSRNRIFENESRLSRLLHGYVLLLLIRIIHRTPVLSPCTRTVKAKELIVEGREKEARGMLNEALALYKQGKILSLYVLLVCMNNE